jgi:hypothetical protein
MESTQSHEQIGYHLNMAIINASTSLTIFTTVDTRAVQRWVAANPSTDEEVQSILGSVRLSLMTTQDLLKVVRPTGLVLPDVLLDAIESKTESRDTELRYRGYLSKFLYSFCKQNLRYKWASVLA